MGSRVITLQRQARELGRLRTGYTDFSGKKPKPVKSKTWIVTSHSEDYVRAAAELWGGTPEKWQPLGNGAEQWRVTTGAVTLDAILPPGDPLDQNYEMWSRGGCQRRCDGVREMQSDKPCLCRDEYGEDFHETGPKLGVCKITTRLGLLLPEMPDIGTWRMETHSYYSANEVAAALDMLKGALGPAALIPVRLRIEQRTRVANGETKHFPVVAVELRGATAGQLLAGELPQFAVGAGRQQAAIAAPDQAGFPAMIRAAATRNEVLKVWEAAKRAGAPAQEVEAAARERVAQLAVPFTEAMRGAADYDQLTSVLEAAQESGFAENLSATSDPVAQAFIARRRELVPPAEPAAPQPAAPAAQAPTLSREQLWQQVLMAWPGDRTSDCEAALSEKFGVLPSQATPEQLAEFLTDLQPATNAGGTATQVRDKEVPF